MEVHVSHPGIILVMEGAEFERLSPGGKPSLPSWRLFYGITGPYYSTGISSLMQEGLYRTCRMTSIFIRCDGSITRVVLPQLF